MEFSVGDLVFVKVSPLRKVVRFGRKGKLAPRFVGPFLVLEQIGTLAYRVGLPEKMARVHDVFHVSQLRKGVHDLSDNLEPRRIDDLVIEPDLTVVRSPLRIVATDERKL